MDFRAILCKYRLDLPSVYIMLVCEIKHTQVNIEVITNYQELLRTRYAKST